MSNYKSSLVFFILFISLYCTAFSGLPELEAKYLESYNDSLPIHADTKKEIDSLEVPYTSEHKENKHAQEIAHPIEDVRYLAEEAVPDTTEQNNILATPTPMLSFTPTDDVKYLIEEEKEAHTPLPEEEIFPATPVGMESAGVTDGYVEEEPLIEDVQPQHDIVTESHRDTEEESVTSVMATPAIEEEKEAHTPLPEEELFPATPVGMESTGVTDGYVEEEPLTEDVQPQHDIVTESHRDTEEESVTSVMATPAIEEEKEAHTPLPEEEIFPATPVGMESAGVTDGYVEEEPLIEDVQPQHDIVTESHRDTEEESVTSVMATPAIEEEKEAHIPSKATDVSIPGVAQEEHHIDALKEDKETKPAWDIWHKDPSHGVILAVAIILIAAKIAEWLARRWRLPAVVGKLIMGMILGNVITFTGWDFFDFLRTMPFVKMISYFGTLILLFTAGLNTDLRALLRAGTSSLLVCLGGIIAPAGLGLMIGHFLLPDTSGGTKLLLAIILCNSSTGLLFAVLSELKAINTLEGRVIAGATILTDIVVILTFGVVSGFVVKDGGSLVGMSVSFGIAITSLIISLIAILKYGDKFGSFLTRRLTEGLNIPIVVILSLLLAFMFGSIGLHTVIGAFVAGLFLRNVKLRNSDDGGHRNVESFVRPFYMLLVPILFVRVGAQVELESFFNLNAVLLGLAITGASFIGKMFCSVCPIEKGINRLAIGIGMATKMEGTLILAGLGRDMGILSDTVFSAVIMAIVFTSIICPSLLRNILRKKGGSHEILPVVKGKKELEGAVLS